MTADNVRFRRPVVPGDQMRIHVEKSGGAAGPISFADMFMSAMNLPPKVKLWP